MIVCEIDGSVVIGSEVLNSIVLDIIFIFIFSLSSEFFYVDLYHISTGKKPLY